jgi:hypothetical protein
MQLPGPLREDRDVRELQLVGDVLEEGRLLAARLDEQDLEIRPRDRQRDAGKAGAGAEVEEPPAVLEDRGARRASRGRGRGPSRADP